MMNSDLPRHVLSGRHHSPASRLIYWTMFDTMVVVDCVASTL